MGGNFLVDCFGWKFVNRWRFRLISQPGAGKAAILFEYKSTIWAACEFWTAHGWLLLRRKLFGWTLFGPCCHNGKLYGRILFGVRSYHHFAIYTKICELVLAWRFKAYVLVFFPADM